MDGLKREERLQKARQVFAVNSQNQAVCCTIPEQRKSSVTYMQGFFLRGMIALLLVVFLGLYGIAVPEKFMFLRNWTEKQVASNPFIQDAYTTYTEMDYREMMREFAEVMQKN